MKDNLGFEYEYRSKFSGKKVVSVQDKTFSFYDPHTSKYLYKHEVYKFISLFAKLK